MKDAGALAGVVPLAIVVRRCFSGMAVSVLLTWCLSTVMVITTLVDSGIAVGCSLQLSGRCYAGGQLHHQFFSDSGNTHFPYNVSYAVFGGLTPAIISLIQHFIPMAHYGI